MKAAIAVSIAIVSVRGSGSRSNPKVTGTSVSEETKVTALVATMNGGNGKLSEGKKSELTEHIRNYFHEDNSLLFTQVEPANSPEQTKDIAKELKTDGVVVYENQRKDSSALMKELTKLLSGENID